MSDSLVIKTVVTYDSSVIELRTPPASKMEELRQDPDFNYNREQPKEKNWWDRFADWLSGKIGEMLDTKGGRISLTALEYLLIVAAIVLIVFLLLKNNVRSAFYGKSASLAIDVNEFVEDIHAIDFDGLIKEALLKLDYRRAVRLHFLKILKQLSDKNLIHWKPGKTNRDYSTELANTDYSSGFNELSFLYEYTWYGNFVLSDVDFNKTVEKFKSFQI